MPIRLIDSDQRIPLREQVMNRLVAHRSEWYPSKFERRSKAFARICIIVGLSLLVSTASDSQQPELPLSEPVTAGTKIQSPVSAYRVRILSENPNTLILNYYKSLQIPVPR